MWNTLGKALTKAAIWCVKHPDKIIAIAAAAKAAKEQVQ